MGRAAVALIRVGGFGEGEEPEFVGRNVVEGSEGLVGLGRREHEPGELGREMGRGVRG